MSGGSNTELGKNARSDLNLYVIWATPFKARPHWLGLSVLPFAVRLGNRAVIVWSLCSPALSFFLAAFSMSYVAWSDDVPECRRLALNASWSRFTICRVLRLEVCRFLQYVTFILLQERKHLVKGRCSPCSNFAIASPPPPPACSVFSSFSLYPLS